MCLLKATDAALLHGDQSRQGSHNTPFVVFIVWSVGDDVGRRKDLEAVEEGLCLRTKRKATRDLGSLLLRLLLLLLLLLRNLLLW